MPDMGVCIKEKILDLKDYATGGTVFRRKAARGIIRHQGRYLVIHGKYGDYKFPGGGMKEGENLTDTLVREVQEETGYRVIADSIRDYILVHEKRKGNPEDLLEMDSWYFFCDVEEGVFARNLDDYEKEYDYQAAWLPLRDTIQKNEAVKQYEKIPWVVREIMVMRELWESVELVPAGAEDAGLLHRMQIEAFMPLYEKYHDDETSPAKETLERITEKITEDNSEFYMIRYAGEAVGGVRVRHYQGNKVFDNISWISPIFVIPAFWNRGIAGKAIQEVIRLYPETVTWRLDTIKQEAGNCHLYEKCGFVRVGDEHKVNEKMTLVDYEKSSLGSGH